MGGINLTSQGNLSVGGDVAGRDIVKQEAPPVGVVGLHQIPPPDFTGRRPLLMPKPLSRFTSRLKTRLRGR
ncbi:MAG: hypothetical protein HY260_22810 [Chloroflexi bacterium]|nr:hypothetical protein [Chloroflexota bacterium]